MRTNFSFIRLHYWQQEKFSWAQIFHQLWFIQEDKLATTHLSPPWFLMEQQGWHLDSHHQLLSLSLYHILMPTTCHQPIVRCQNKDLPVKRIHCWPRTENREQIRISKKLRQKGKNYLIQQFNSYNKGLKDWRKSLLNAVICLGATQDHGFHLNHGISSQSCAGREGHNVQKNVSKDNSSHTQIVPIPSHV